jgi:hypothetical protein
VRQNIVYSESNHLGIRVAVCGSASVPRVSPIAGGTWLLPGLKSATGPTTGRRNKVLRKPRTYVVLAGSTITTHSGEAATTTNPN